MIELGISIVPAAAELATGRMLIADLLARTERIRIFPDVANLPLRGPMIAKQAASPDVLAGDVGAPSYPAWPGLPTSR